MPVKQQRAKGLARSGRKTKVSKEKCDHSVISLEAFKLRCQGLQFKEIAKRLNVSMMTAHRMTVKELGEINKLREAEARTLTDQLMVRYEDMLAVVYPKAKQGDLYSIDRAIAIIDKMAKIWGLPVETKREGSHEAPVQIIINESIKPPREPVKVEQEEPLIGSVDGSTTPAPPPLPQLEEVAVSSPPVSAHEVLRDLMLGK
jgi:hypothetical protein